MPIPIILAFAAAGALAGGGIGTAVGGFAWFRKTINDAAKDESTSDSKNIVDILQQATTEQQVRDAAEAAGVDVEAAVAGYEAAKKGLVNLTGVAVKIVAGEVAVPLSGSEMSEDVLRRARPIITADGSATNAEIRAWGRDNGFEPADRGPLAKPLVEAFMRAH